MSVTPPQTVKDTGAEVDDVLVGVTQRNLGLVLRIHNEQEPGQGGRIRGPFDIVHWGTGTYANELRSIISIMGAGWTADELVAAIREHSGSSDFTHALNANGLWRLDAHEIAERIIFSNT